MLCDKIFIALFPLKIKSIYHIIYKLINAINDNLEELNAYKCTKHKALYSVDFRFVSLKPTIALLSFSLLSVQL